MSEFDAFYELIEELQRRRLADWPQCEFLAYAIRAYVREAIHEAINPPECD